MIVTLKSQSHFWHKSVCDLTTENHGDKPRSKIGIDPVDVRDAATDGRDMSSRLATRIAVNTFPVQKRVQIRIGSLTRIHRNHLQIPADNGGEERSGRGECEIENQRKKTLQLTDSIDSVYEF